MYHDSTILTFGAIKLCEQEPWNFTAEFCSVRVLQKSCDWTTLNSIVWIGRIHNQFI